MALILGRIYFQTLLSCEELFGVFFCFFSLELVLCGIFLIVLFTSMFANLQSSLTSLAHYQDKKKHSYFLKSHSANLTLFSENMQQNRITDILLSLLNQIYFIFCIPPSLNLIHIISVESTYSGFTLFPPETQKDLYNFFSFLF